MRIVEAQPLLSRAVLDSNLWLATHVVVHHGAKKGKIEIEYYGDDDLQRLLDLFGLGEE